MEQEKPQNQDLISLIKPFVMKPIIYLSLAILPLSLAATGFTLIFKFNIFKRYLNNAIACNLFFSYLFLFFGIVLVVKFLISLFSKSDS
jgi:hypothetical protein